tara:strand:- start:744 stop:1619 length:876 start_codon:yes stop_codon:yes gene_type:complete
MKKNYIFTFILALFNLLAYAQTPMITAILDGDCTGGNPKLLELYANGEVDFSLYSIQNQSNAGTTWGNTQDLVALATVTDAFVYISTSGSATSLASEFPSITGATPTLISNTVNINGDDRIRIILTSDETVIDQYGVSSEDGSGKPWEYADSYAKRVDGTSFNGSFVEANWAFAGVSALNNLGICQGGTDSFETLMGGIGTYTASTASVKNNAIAGFATYPNPITNHTFTLTSASSEEKSVTVFNLLGKKVLETRFSGIKSDINVSAINAGIYILKVTESGKTASKKLVIR